MNLISVLVDLFIYTCIYLITRNCKLYATDFVKTIYDNYERNDIMMITISLCILSYNMYKCACRRKETTTGDDKKSSMSTTILT